MRWIHERRAERSDELAALAKQVHDLENSATTSTARLHYAAVAAEYDRDADAMREMEQAEHKLG